jgi:hypothetical protein
MKSTGLTASIPLPAGVKQGYMLSPALPRSYNGDHYSSSGGALIPLF